jgi:hypothetical protein
MLNYKRILGWLGVLSGAIKVTSDETIDSKGEYGHKRGEISGEYNKRLPLPR